MLWLEIATGLVAALLFLASMLYGPSRSRARLSRVPQGRKTHITLGIATLVVGLIHVCLVRISLTGGMPFPSSGVFALAGVVLTIVSGVISRTGGRRHATLRMVHLVIAILTILMIVIHLVMVLL